MPTSVPVAVAHTEVHRCQLVGSDLIGPAGPDDAAEPEHSEHVGDGHDVARLLLDQDHGHTVVPQLGQDGHHLLHDLWGQPEIGLVGDEDAGPVDQEGGQGQDLLLAAGEHVGVDRFALGQRWEAVVDPVALLPLGQEDLQVLVDGQSAKDASGLGGHQETPAGAPVGGAVGGVLLAQRHTPARGLDPAGHDVAEGRFPGPVAAEHAEQLTRSQIQGDAMEDVDAVVTGSHVFETEDRSARGTPGAMALTRTGSTSGMASASRLRRLGPGQISLASQTQYAPASCGRSNHRDSWPAPPRPVRTESAEWPWTSSGMSRGRGRPSRSVRR